MVSFLDASLSGKKKLHIGLDIGSSHLKAVAIELVRKELNLHRIAWKELPRNSIVDKDVSDRESVIFTIQNLMEEFEAKAHDVTISVSGNKVFSDKITVKKPAKSNALAEQVMTQAEERIPMGTEGISIGFFPITDNEIGKAIDVEIVAARADFIKNYVEIVHDAGYNVVAVDVDGLSIYNTFEHNYEMAPESVICLIDIGHSITNLVFIIQGRFFSMRVISVGMNTIWDVIQGELQFSTDDMENLMHGIYDGVDPAQFRKAIYIASGDLKVSLDTAFTYLESITQGQKVNKIYLSGGGALVPNLEEAIAEQMGIDTEILNPFLNVVFDPAQFVNISPEQIAPIFTVATGLALRAD